MLKEEQQIKKIYDETESHIKNRLSQLIQPSVDFEGSPLINYKWYFEREKTLYDTLNLFQSEKTWFKGLCWCPMNKRAEVDDAINLMRSAKKVVCSNLKEVQDHELAPPTHFQVNSFIRPFQEIVFTYGVPTYKEANPTLFTIVSFPFLFGVMFGDLAHGLVLLSFGSYICLRKDYLIRTKSALADVVEYRYLLLMLGVFATFCGFLYNDFAAVPLSFMPSCFDKQIEGTEEYERTDPSCVYPTSFDPIWYAATNELQFVNSFKMKFSVIIGVIHMTLGVIQKGLNAIYFKKPIDFFHEFLPQVIFITTFFGYMNFMIIVKWVTDWSSVHQNAPAIITLLIGIPLKGSDPGPIPLYGDGSVQKLVGITISCTFPS